MSNLVDCEILEVSYNLKLNFENNHLQLTETPTPIKMNVDHNKPSTFTEKHPESLIPTPL